MQSQRPDHWYNINSRELPTGDAPSKKGGFALPPAVRRAQAKNSAVGGRCQCFWCHEYFTVNYCQVCVTGFFTEPEWGCADCRKTLKLRKVAK